MRGLLVDCAPHVSSDLFTDVGMQMRGVKSSFIKKLLVHEFGETTGSYDRFKMNESTFVYDSQDGSSTETTTDSWSISIQQLLQNTVQPINKEVHDLTHISRPPTVDKAIHDVECIKFLTKFSNLQELQ